LGKSTIEDPVVIYQPLSSDRFFSLDISTLLTGNCHVSELPMNQRRWILQKPSKSSREGAPIFVSDLELNEANHRFCVIGRPADVAYGKSKVKYSYDISLFLYSLRDDDEESSATEEDEMILEG
jgi:hypothetical protein